MIEVEVKNVQDVADDSQRPHVRGASDRFVTDYFRGDEFGRAEEDTHRLIGIQLTGQSEIDQFDSMRIGTLTKDVFRLCSTVRDHVE